MNIITLLQYKKRLFCHIFSYFVLLQAKMQVILCKKLTTLKKEMCSAVKKNYLLDYLLQTEMTLRSDN